MTAIDLSKILSKYKTGWIALTEDNKKIVADGKTLNEVLKKARKSGVDNPSLLKASPINNLLVG